MSAIRRALLDLGCSFGLLAHRIAKITGAKAVGIDASERTLLAAIKAGVDIQMVCLKVDRGAIDALCGLIRQQGVSVLIARRVLPELWGEDIDGGKEFAGAIADAGVTEVFIEGRVQSPSAVSPLRSIAEEVALMSDRFREVRRVGPVSYLRRK